MNNSKFKQFVVLLSFSILFTNCNKKSNLEYEQDVFREIFPSLLDSVWLHDNGRNSIPFIKLDKNGEPIGVEKLTEEERIKRSYQELKIIKKNKDSIYITIDKLIEPLTSSLLKELKQHFKNAQISQHDKIDSVSYTIDEKRLKIPSVYNISFESIKKSIDDSEKVHESPPYSLNGTVSFSRILFDSNKKYGILEVSVICGGLCGNGYNVFVKKVNGKWIIDKIEHSWIS